MTCLKELYQMSFNSLIPTGKLGRTDAKARRDIYRVRSSLVSTSSRKQQFSIYQHFLAYFRHLYYFGNWRECLLSIYTILFHYNIMARRNCTSSYVLLSPNLYKLIYTHIGSFSRSSNFVIEVLFAAIDAVFCSGMENVLKL